MTAVKNFAKIQPSVLVGTDNCFTVMPDVEFSVMLQLCGTEQINNTSVNSSLVFSLKLK